MDVNRLNFSLTTKAAASECSKKTFALSQEENTSAVCGNTGPRIKPLPWLEHISYFLHASTAKNASFVPREGVITDFTLVHTH